MVDYLEARLRSSGVDNKELQIPDEFVPEKPLPDLVLAAAAYPPASYESSPQEHREPESSSRLQGWYGQFADKMRTE